MPPSAPAMTDRAAAFHPLLPGYGAWTSPGRSSPSYEPSSWGMSTGMSTASRGEVVGAVPEADGGDPPPPVPRKDIPHPFHGAALVVAVAHAVVEPAAPGYGEPLEVGEAFDLVQLLLRARTKGSENSRCRARDALRASRPVRRDTSSTVMSPKPVMEEVLAVSSMKALILAYGMPRGCTGRCP